MRMSPSRKSRLERRIRELRKESDLVRTDIRTLSKVVRNREELDALPKLKSGRNAVNPVPPPSRTDPVRKRTEENVVPIPPPRAIPVMEPAAPAPSPAPPRREFLFDPEKAPEPAETASKAAKNPASRDERFASYFSSGGFLGGKPMRQEQSVQRNKAIFMLVVVGIVFFIVYQLVTQ